MLFNILKLFGLDVPAQIAAAKASLEQRVEHATEHVKQAAQEVAVIAALSALASLAAATAAGVGLVALYMWIADAYGPFAGLGAVGTILVMVTAILAAAAATKAKSLSTNRMKLPTSAAAATSSAGLSMNESVSARDEPLAGVTSWEPPIAVATPSTTSARDLIGPLALMSRFVKYPSVGNPLVDELLGSLRTTAHGATEEAIDHAADVIRHGDRANLIVVLTGAACLGWLLSHHSRR
jgi:hypothetical protein